MTIALAARRSLFLGLSPLASGAALLAGLAASAMPRGLVDPLDWLIPCTLGMAVVFAAAGLDLRRPLVALAAALLALPPTLFVLCSAATVPWAGMLTFLACLAAFAGTVAYWPRWIVLLAGLACVAAVRLAALELEVDIEVREGPAVAVSSALPLLARAGADSPIEGVGTRAPIIEGLAAVMRPEPIDALAPESLSRYARLLLIQPRLLSPAELVALDAWVRNGGHVTILADPWLAWSEEGALTRSGRAPLTSLLDPLLAHWGLVLEPAELARERSGWRILSNGAAIRTVAGSRFSLIDGGGCVLKEEGLMADCRVGRGRAFLVADADWLDAAQWTSTPETPLARRNWTSDAVPTLARLVLGEPALVPSRGWIASHERQVEGLRAGLVAIGLLWLVMLWQALRRAVSQPHPQADRSARGGRRPPSPDSG